MSKLEIVRRVLVAAVAVLLVYGGVKVGGMFAAREQPQGKQARPPSIRQVKTLVVAYSEQETEFEYYGRVASSQPVDLASEIQGRMLRGAVPLKAGQNFRKGSLLFQLDSEELRLNIQSQKSQFLKSLADVLADIKLDYSDRFATWETYFQQIDMDKSLPKLPEITDLKEKTFLSSRGIQSSYYSILSQEERLSKYRVYAPFSGSFAEVYQDIGAVINPGTRVARIIRTGNLELVAPVNISDVDWVKPGTKVDILSEDESQKFPGKVARVGDLVDPTTQSVNVYIQFQTTKSSTLFEGMYLKAKIPGKKVANAMRIPRKSLFDQDQVFTVSKGKLKKNSIVLHKLDPNSALISGLPLGDSLVAEIPINASENMPVRSAGKQ